MINPDLDQIIVLACLVLVGVYQRLRDLMSCTLMSHKLLCDSSPNRSGAREREREKKTLCLELSSLNHLLFSCCHVKQPVYVQHFFSGWNAAVNLLPSYWQLPWKGAIKFRRTIRKSNSANQLYKAHLIVKTPILDCWAQEVNDDAHSTPTKELTLINQISVLAPSM